MFRRLFTALSALSLLLCAATVFGSSGCIAVPVPHPERAAAGSRLPIGAEDTAFIEVGTTTRDDVVRRLREPDEWWELERVMVYRWTTTNLSLVPLMGFYHPDVFGDMSSPISRFLLVRLDARGRVSGFERKTAPPFKAGAGYARELREQWRDL